LATVAAGCSEWGEGCPGAFRSFVRALAHELAIFVLVEVTSSVDTQTEIRIREALRLLIRSRTSLVIAHRRSTIRRLDRVLVAHKGRLVDQGTHEGLLAGEGIYAKLYQLEFKGQKDEVEWTPTA
jgi:ATP-binding cassette subfamily B protein